MSSLNEEIKNDRLTIEKVCDFLQIDENVLVSAPVTEQIKQACALRLGRAVEVRFKFNFKSPYFEFFSSLMGEAVCRHLGLNLEIAPDKFRLFKYNGKNLVHEIETYLNEFSVEEAFLQTFEFLEDYLYLIK